MKGLNMTRRGFLQMAGLAAASAAAAACQATPAPTAAPTEAPTVAPKEAATVAPTEAPTVAATAAPVEVAGKYNEAPMLAELVKAGKLPPVEERLPKNPMVIEPLEKVGKYGGTWHRCDASIGSIVSRHGAEGLVNYARDAKSFEPGLADKWEVSEDGTTYTFHLREGLRWSDGEPFTADDIMFWYEDVLLNKEITPAFPKWFAPGGKEAIVEKVDDFTIRIKFAVPYGILFDILAFNAISMAHYPKHYLKDYHIKYADKDQLEKLTKERGFEQWFQLFGSLVDFTRNPDLPVIKPWKITSKDWTTTAVAERNPYYYKVDTQGNQLPYIDKIAWIIVQSADMIPLHIVQGEVDKQCRSTGIVNYTLYMENREKGGYEVRIWDYGSSGTSMHVNQTKKVPEGDAAAQEMSDLLKNRDFRLGLSMGINRDAVNELVYQGLAAPGIELFPESVRNDPEVQKAFEFNQDEANAILDSLGLDKRDGDGMRLTPSGKPLNLIVIGHVAYALHRDVAEVVTNNWAEIGVRATMDWIPNETWWPRVQEGDFDVVAYECDYIAGNRYWLTYPRSFFPVEPSTYWAPQWGNWYATGGTQGLEPEADAKTLIDLYEKARVTVDPVERDKVCQEAFAICAKNLWPIQTVGSRPEPCIVKHGFMNVPETNTMAWPVYGERTAKPEQYYMEYA